MASDSVLECDHVEVDQPAHDGVRDEAYFFLKIRAAFPEFPEDPKKTPTQHAKTLERRTERRFRVFQQPSVRSLERTELERDAHDREQSDEQQQHRDDH